MFIFLKIPKNNEIQNFEPKKWPEPTYVWKYQSTPPPLGDGIPDKVLLFFLATWVKVQNFQNPELLKFQF